MRLLESDGKDLFRKYGIPVPEGIYLEGMEGLSSLSYPCILKAQILSGGRGKAGLIRRASSPEEAKETIGNFLAQKGVFGVLAEPLVSIHRELFAAVALDRTIAAPVLMVSVQGGMEVEKAAPEDLLRNPFDDGNSWNFHQFLDLLISIGLQGKVLAPTAAILKALAKLFFAEDALSVEINPLAISTDEKVLALDAKITLDDGAFFRHPAWREMRSFGLEIGEGLEREAQKARLSYVSIPGGSIGVIAGGAGLGMATMDSVSLQGGMPGVFIDIGGGVAEESMAEAVRIARQTAGIEGLLINVFGGINNCQIMARGIVRDLKRQEGARIPLVVKTRGHFQEEGWALLMENQVPVVKFGTTEEAVQMLLSLVRGKKAN